MGGGYRTGGPDRSDEYEDRRPPREERLDAIQTVQEAAAAAQAAMNRRNGDDEGTEGAEAKSPGSTSVREIDGIGKTKGSALEDAGYRTITDLRSASREQLLAVSGIGPQTADLLQAKVSEQAPPVAVHLNEDVERAIEETPVAYDIALHTEEARREAAEATAAVGELYRSTARRFAVHSRNTRIARTTADHIDRVEYRPTGNPVFDVTAVGPNDTGTLFLPEEATTDDVNHELGHVVSDGFGYGRGRASVEAENEYGRRLLRGESDPFIANDPNNSEFWLTQENGEHVNDVPEEFDTLMDETNQAWERIQRHYQSGGVDEAENYTIRNNYSSTGASEVFAQLTEVMQSNAPDANEHLLDNQPDLIAAYRECFTPSDTVRDWIDQHEKREESDRERS